MEVFDFNSERLLWSAYVRGDRSAFSDIYKEYSESLFQYGLKLTSDINLVQDNIQELFIELWNTREKKADVTHIKTYLISSLRYKLIKTFQTNSSVSIEDFENQYFTDSKEAEIILHEIDSQKSHQVRKIISTLPKRHQEIIHLKYYQGLSNDQISEVLSMKKQSVSNLLNRAISGIRKKISKKVSSY